MYYKLLTVLLFGDYGELIFIVLFSIFPIFYNQHSLLQSGEVKKPSKTLFMKKRNQNKASFFCRLIILV